jgi:hypothetical protein
MFDFTLTCCLSACLPSCPSYLPACRSRFPGLSVWLADGRRLPVSIPPGCLLCQAGKQLEWLTGGHVKAGMHEVGLVLLRCCTMVLGFGADACWFMLMLPPSARLPGVLCQAAWCARQASNWNGSRGPCEGRHARGIPGAFWLLGCWVWGA